METPGDRRARKKAKKAAKQARKDEKAQEDASSVGVEDDSAVGAAALRDLKKKEKRREGKAHKVLWSPGRVITTVKASMLSKRSMVSRSTTLSRMGMMVS